MAKLFFLALLCVPFFAHADKAIIVRPPEPVSISEEQKIKAPWLTGPLLAPSGTTIPPKHYYIEPYIYAVANTGQYNRDWEVVKTETLWNIYTQPTLQFGLNKWLDFQFNPTLFYNYTKGAASWALGDMVVGFDIQLYKGGGNKPTSWYTALKLVLKENLPLGKYRNLNPKKRGTDDGGVGSWITTFGLVWGQLVHVTGQHFFDTRLSVQYSLPAPVHVKGFNNYGGGYGTDGKVYPAQNFQVDLGMEFTFNLNWVACLDIVGSWSGRGRFVGKPGVGANGLPATVGTGSAVQFALAPGIEYNWSANIGIVFGPWFTIGGRKAVQFESGVFAFSYYH